METKGNLLCRDGNGWETRSLVSRFPPIGRKWETKGQKPVLKGYPSPRKRANEVETKWKRSLVSRYPPMFPLDPLPSDETLLRRLFGSILGP